MDIKFTYSRQYQLTLAPEQTPPGIETINEKLSMLEDFFANNKDQIISAFQKVTGLSFVQEYPFTCYINGTATFSDPLSIKIEDDLDMQDNLVHELIHILLTDNKIGETNAWKELASDFSKESFVTRVHIVVHAIHVLVYQIINPNRIVNIKEYSKKEDYIKSWNIVENIGAKQIVSKYLNIK